VGIVSNFGNQMALSTSKKKREPRGRDSGTSRSSPSFGPPWLVARLSHLPKSETECDVTPPGDAGPGAVSMTITPKNGRQIGS
jgi:hypothetical protein